MGVDRCWRARVWKHVSCGFGRAHCVLLEIRYDSVRNMRAHASDTADTNNDLNSFSSATHEAVMPNHKQALTRIPQRIRTHWCGSQIGNRACAGHFPWAIQYLVSICHDSILLSLCWFRGGSYLWIIFRYWRPWHRWISWNSVIICRPRLVSKVYNSDWSRTSWV